jgi:putative DNA primase/helicase
MEDSEPMDPTCFELDTEKVKKDEFIEFFTMMILSRFTIKHFVKNGRSVDLYMWVDGRYIPCEERLKAFIEAEADKLQISSKVKTHLVREVVEKVKRRTYHELREDDENSPRIIAFKNCLLNWGAFLDGDLDMAVRPLEESREEPVFHLIPHRLDVDLLRKLNGVEDLDGAMEEVCPVAVKTFRDWTAKKDDERSRGLWRLLLEIIGYTLYPGYPLHKALMLVGDGSNGKSTYLQLIVAILSRENVIGKSLQELCNERFAASELYHKLANTYPDIPKQPLRYTGMFKALTGEDLISADRKFKPSISFVNYAKLLFSANELPEVTDQTYAFWRRWIVVEFPNKFPEDPGFFESTFTEEVLEKIIILSLLAFRRVYHARRFSIGEEAGADFKEKWLRKVSNVYNYVKTGLEEGWIELDKSREEVYTQCETLYESYRDWCDENDLKPEEKATFTKELERYFGIQKKRRREFSKRIYVYQGIRLREEAKKEA